MQVQPPDFRAFFPDYKKPLTEINNLTTTNIHQIKPQNPCASASWLDHLIRPNPLYLFAKINRLPKFVTNESKNYSPPLSFHTGTERAKL